MAFELFVLAVGLLGSFTSALLGSGGGLIMVSFLMFLPPLVGLPPIDVKTAGGLGTVQILFATVLGTLAHGRRGMVDRSLVLWSGTAMTVAGMLAAILSSLLPSLLLSTVFAALATGAGLLMAFPARHGDERDWDGSFSRPLAAGVGGGAGGLVGLVGTGTFLLTPSFIHLLHVPTRIAIGTTLGGSILGGLAAAIGKASTGQVPLNLAIMVLLATIPGVILGSWASSRLPPRLLRYLLAGLITFIALRAWWTLFQ